MVSYEVVRSCCDSTRLAQLFCTHSYVTRKFSMHILMLLYCGTVLTQYSGTIGDEDLIMCSIADQLITVRVTRLRMYQGRAYLLLACVLVHLSQHSIKKIGGFAY